jgi:prepilin-type N-terminal cleavage/methylation domain-containing protein
MTPDSSTFIQRRPAAFTLVELLTVVAVIGILAGILIPVAANARARARDSKCISNLRQIGVATGAYVADNRGFLPVNPYGADGYPAGVDRWYYLLAPYIGKDSSDRREQGSVFMCPANLAENQGGNYADFATWTDFGYICNLQLMPKLAGGATGTPVRMASVQKRRILASDGLNKEIESTQNWVYYGNTSLENSRKPFPSITTGGWSVHGTGIHALWTDYSVSWIAESDVNRPGNQITGGQYFGRGN